MRRLAALVAIWAGLGFAVTVAVAVLADEMVGAVLARPLVWLGYGLIFVWGLAGGRDSWIAGLVMR
jgi:hypothetical protein